MARSLADLRRDAGGAIGELVLITATAGTTAPAGSIIDSVHLIDPTNSWAGGDLLIVSGACAGHRARTTASSFDLFSLSFHPACPAAVAAGDRAELYGAHHNVRLEQLDAWIRQAQEDAFPNYRLPHAETLLDPYDPETDPTIEVPHGFTHVHTVRYPTADGGSVSVPPGRSDLGEGWHLLPGRRLQIDGASRRDAAGQLLTLLGYRKDTPLTRDTDETGLSGEWIVQMVRGYYLLSLGSSVAYQQGAQALARADALRAKIVTPVAPNTRLVVV